MLANPILLQIKYCRIIKLLSCNLNIPVADALEIFYNSLTYKQMSQGISDMHCRSDEYLVENIIYEYHNY